MATKKNWRRVRGRRSSRVVPAIVVVCGALCAQLAHGVTMRDFAIFSDTQVTLGRRVIVFADSGVDGMVGANGALEIRKAASTFSLMGEELAVDEDDDDAGGVGTRTFIDGNIVINGDLRILPAAEIAGNVDAGGLLLIGRDSTIAGNATAGGDVVVNMDATIQGNLGANGDIRMEMDSTVVGTITHGGMLNDSAPGATHGPASPGTVSPRSFEGLPPLVPTTFSVGSEDLTTVRGVTTQLAPGAYGDFRLGTRNTLELEAGDYFF